jgi:hypothetical protein
MLSVRSRLFGHRVAGRLQEAADRVLYWKKVKRELPPVNWRNWIRHAYVRVRLQRAQDRFFDTDLRALT